MLEDQYLEPHRALEQSPPVKDAAQDDGHRMTDSLHGGAEHRKDQRLQNGGIAAPFLPPRRFNHSPASATQAGMAYTAPASSSLSLPETMVQ